MRGADYKSTYGISASGDELSLQFVTGCQQALYNTCASL